MLADLATGAKTYSLKTFASNRFQGAFFGLTLRLTLLRLASIGTFEPPREGLS